MSTMAASRAGVRGQAGCGKCAKREARAFTAFQHVSYVKPLRFHCLPPSVVTNRQPPYPCEWFL